MARGRAKISPMSDDHFQRVKHLLRCERSIQWRRVQDDFLTPLPAQLAAANMSECAQKKPPVCFMADPAFRRSGRLQRSFLFSTCGAGKSIGSSLTKSFVATRQKYVAPHTKLDKLCSRSSAFVRIPCWGLFIWSVFLTSGLQCGDV